jgi:hypothetical protein
VRCVSQPKKVNVLYNKTKLLEHFVKKWWHNLNKIIESTSDINISIVIDDIDIKLGITKKSFKNNKFSKFNLKDTKVYKFIKNR